MSIFGCRCKCNCLLAAAIASVILGVVAAFLQIMGMITVTPAFLWVVLGIAVVYLGVLLVAAALTEDTAGCLCPALNGLLVGILGAALFAVVLLGIGIVATSVLSAVLVGLLLFFFSFTLSTAACLVRSLAACGCC